LPSEKDRGDAFEVFAEAYLSTQKSAQAKEVWPDRAVPSRILRALSLPAKDMGVDGVAESVTGGFDAYQVKFRSHRASLIRL
jgi:predicted helicase